MRRRTPNVNPRTARRTQGLQRPPPCSIATQGSEAIPRQKASGGLRGPNAAAANKALLGDEAYQGIHFLSDPTRANAKRFLAYDDFEEAASAPLWRWIDAPAAEWSHARWSAGGESLLAIADAHHAGAPDRAGEVWDALVEAGVTPVGLGARDTLRLEVCFHLYGNDLSEDREPISGGLGWAIKEHTGFIGAEPIAKVRAAGPAEKLVSFTLTEKGIARQGNPILVDGQPVGVVTSGTLSPSLDVGIGMGYLRSDLAVPGTALQIDVRGTMRPAIVATKPLYTRKETNG